MAENTRDETVSQTEGIRLYPWKPGQSGNPGGRKFDCLREGIDRIEGKARPRLTSGTVLSFVVHVPGPDIIGKEAHE